MGYTRIRQVICEKLSQIIKVHDVSKELKVPVKRQQNVFTLQWTTSTATATGKDGEKRLLQLIPQLEFDKNLVHAVHVIPADVKNAPKIEFQLSPQAFVEDALLQQPVADELQNRNCKKHMIFEFSSPNIAKPFHVGHLRSTIIGNVLANLHQHLGYQVTKLNYLGDWGTQFGMLQVGVEMLAINDEQMRLNPIERLYEAYVAANAAAKNDPSIAEKARQYFTQLETGTNESMSKEWQQYRNYTIGDLEKMYSRLGVHFDQYDWESQYSQRDIVEVLDRLSAKSLLLDELDGRKVVNVDGRRVPIIKSDGSTLYLARDIAALIDRFERYRFDQIFYIVDNAQSDHFRALFKTTAALCDDIDETRLHHVKFGRIRGMSTRTGNAIFLNDVLDEARDIMLEKQLKSPTTKVNLANAADEGYKNVADILGVTAVIINDLKQRRQRDYDFDWDKVLQVNGDTGIKLQYTHCRLHSLLETIGDVDVNDIKPDAKFLNEAEAQDLLYEIMRFEQTLWLAKEQLEACILINYLFSLCNSTSRALKRLNVKNETCRERQENRILLFTTAKRILNKGMNILGIKALNKM